MVISPEDQSMITGFVDLLHHHLLQEAEVHYHTTLFTLFEQGSGYYSFHNISVSMDREALRPVIWDTVSGIKLNPSRDCKPFTHSILPFSLLRRSVPRSATQAAWLVRRRSSREAN